MLEVIRSFSLQNRVVSFVKAREATELSCRFNLGVTLADDAGRQFVLTGVSSPRGGDPHEVAIVLRSVDGRKGEPAGHLRLVG